LRTFSFITGKAGYVNQGFDRNVIFSDMTRQGKGNKVDCGTDKASPGNTSLA
jgi:hypothetical protein